VNFSSDFYLSPLLGRTMTGGRLYLGISLFLGYFGSDKTSGG